MQTLVLIYDVPVLRTVFVFDSQVRIAAYCDTDFEMKYSDIEL